MPSKTDTARPPYLALPLYLHAFDIGRRQRGSEHVELVDTSVHGDGHAQPSLGKGVYECSIEEN
jgi:hypothetical protein